MTKGIEKSMHCQKTTKTNTQLPLNAEVSDDRIRFICDEASKPVIPVLQSRFQADVPEWTYKAIPNDYENDPDSLKWLSTNIWPLRNGIGQQDGNELIGKGRPAEVCSCRNPGSVGCVHRHVGEERMRLQTELGPVFETWKFHELEEEEFWEWTIKDYAKLIRVVKNTRRSKGGSFLKRPYKMCPQRGEKYSVTTTTFSFQSDLAGKRGPA